MPTHHVKQKKNLFLFAEKSLRGVRGVLFFTNASELPHQR